MEVLENKTFPFSSRSQVWPLMRLLEKVEVAGTGGSRSRWQLSGQSPVFLDNFEWHLNNSFIHKLYI